MRETVTYVIARCDLAGCGAEFDAIHDPLTVTVTGPGYGRKGRTVTLDLCDEHRAEYDKVLSRWLSAHNGKSALPDEKRAKVRAWARAQGMAVADRGKLPTAVVEAYDAAHSKKKGAA